MKYNERAETTVSISAIAKPVINMNFFDDDDEDEDEDGSLRRRRSQVRTCGRKHAGVYQIERTSVTQNYRQICGTRGEKKTNKREKKERGKEEEEGTYASRPQYRDYV